MSTEDVTTMPPLLRWAGGKRWLVPILTELIGDTDIQNYHEPFVGGAAVFFGLELNAKAYLCDLNDALVRTYQQVRDAPEDVWRFLRRYRNTEEEYYAARSANLRNEASRAARFIFLNHASFNGIYRVNLAGQYNVPFGYRSSYNPPDRLELLAASKRLQAAKLDVGDFEDATAEVGPGDLVFLDPPYTVAHNTNGFVKYNDRLFRFADQHRLRMTVERIAATGAYFVLTNAAHQSIADLFDGVGRRIELNRKNAVGGRKALRGSAAEYLFTNLPERR
jgi:DNA adenine methylase